jgi:hypothetical protein
VSDGPRRTSSTNVELMSCIPWLWIGIDRASILWIDWEGAPSNQTPSRKFQRQWERSHFWIRQKDPQKAPGYRQSSSLRGGISFNLPITLRGREDDILDRNGVVPNLKSGGHLRNCFFLGRVLEWQKFVPVHGRQASIWMMIISETQTRDRIGLLGSRANPFHNSVIFGRSDQHSTQTFYNDSIKSSLWIVQLHTFKKWD